MAKAKAKAKGKKAKAKAVPVKKKAKAAPKKKDKTKTTTKTTSRAKAKAKVRGSTRSTPRSRGETLILVARERSADVALVERTLEMLGGRTAAAGLQEVGAHLLDEYFGGDVDAARSNDPIKPRSYSLLEERADEESDWDAADFRRAVTAVIVARSLPEELVGGLDEVWLSRLANVDDVMTRIAVAGRIARGEVRGQAAKDLIAEHSGEVRRGGRTRRPSPVRLAGSLERVLSRVDAEGDLDGDIAEVAPTERPRLLQRLEQVAGRIGRFLDRLRHHAPEGQPETD